MTDLRERVARAIAERHFRRRFAGEASEAHIARNVDANWNLFLEDADAAIAVCREHFAGVADADPRTGYEPYEAVERIVKAIRAEGGNKG